MHDRDLGADTLLSHFGEETKLLGAVTPPIFQNSLFVFPSTDHLLDTLAGKPDAGSYIYSRIGNPTVEIAEKKIAILEGADHCKIFGSGMAAISAGVLSAVSSGSHIVCQETAYGPARELMEKYLVKFGVTVTFVDGRNAQNVFDAVRPETTLIYLESPSSLIFHMQDVPAITAFAKEKGITTMIDNTYSTPLFFNPHRLGVDLVAHSVTKYLGGHSDIVAGALCCSSDRIKSLMQNEVALGGALIHPFPAWLLIRGLRTLGVRIERHQATGNAVASYLEGRKEVDIVHHLGLESFAQRDLVKKYYKGTTSLFSFEPVTQDADKIKAFTDGLEFFQKGISWGGFESLVVPTKMQPAGYNEPKWVIRLYCGLEDAKDLIADIEANMHHLTP